jgi:hypothetical protein
VLNFSGAAKQMERRIIDKRKKEKFMVDDEYLNGMAKLCGWQGTIVYNSLCRHSNINQESFPSVKMMSDQHNVGRNTIFKGIDALESRKVIKVEKKRTKGGQWLNNTYILLDKSEWDYSQVPVEDTACQVPVGYQPSPCGGLNQVPVEDTKETHSKGNTLKETHILSKQSLQGNKLNGIINLFSKVNPSYERFYSNKTQRAALQRMVDKYTEAKVAGFIKYLPIINEDKYARGKSITPLQLEDNLAHIVNHFKANNKKITSV